jgi:hypothetical protein
MHTFQPLVSMVWWLGFALFHWCRMGIFCIGLVEKQKPTPGLAGVSQPMLFVQTWMPRTVWDNGI